MSVAAREIHLKSRPSGLPVPENFELVERRLAAPTEGQLLVRTLLMSVDPYMRGRMIDRQSYIPPFRSMQALDGAHGRHRRAIARHSASSRARSSTISPAGATARYRRCGSEQDRPVRPRRRRPGSDRSAFPGSTPRPGCCDIAAPEGRRDRLRLGGRRRRRLDGRADREDHWRTRHRVGRLAGEGPLGEGRTRRRRRHRLQDRRTT